MGPKKKFDPTTIRYELYDPARHPEIKVELEERITHLRALHGLGEHDMISVKGFTRFSAVVESGWPAVTYASHLIDGPDNEELMFWMTDRHAEMIARALRPTLRILGLELTRLERDGFGAMAAALPTGLRIAELYVIHRSGDEVTRLEGRGLARLVAGLGTQTLHLWAAEYERGALEALTEELERLGSSSLTKVDICDVSKTAPADKVTHRELETILRRNRPPRDRRPTKGGSGRR
jgi:hypothetical protein